ncbi:MAG: cyclic nucleotide-binding protein [Ramlibacter sp.]|nr:cyclic nucleotide-binding protein [Ramlibacter sp.]
MNSRIELLQAMPVFGGVREETLTFLLALSSTVPVAAGEFFFREDDEAQSMFVLEAGRAAVVKNWKGHRFLLSQLAKGDCFGEMSIMDLRHRSASVVAVEACQAIEVSSASLFALYEKDLEQFTLIQMNIGREVSRRLRDADERLFQALVGSANVVAEYVFRST